MRTIINAALVVGFIAVIMVGGRWALMPLLRPPQGLHIGTEADLVRDRYPHRIVDPSSLNMTDDEIGTEWVLAETKARSLRTLVALAAYAALATGVALWTRKRRSANQKLERISGNARVS